MAANNLRIVHRNIVDITGAGAQLVASSNLTTNSVLNLRKDTRSLVWKSNTGINAANVYISPQASATSNINLVALTLTNLTSTATIRVLGYATAPTLTTDSLVITGTASYDTGASLCVPYSTNSLINEWVTTSYNSSTYGLNKVTARVYLNTPIPSGLHIVIQIVNSGATSIEASRLIVGEYWSPKFNTGYGLSSKVNDTSTSQRSEAGDLVTTNGIIFTSMSFDMAWLVPADRTKMMQILKLNGSRKGLFISLFPNNSSDYEKEKDHQIYGKLSQLSTLSYPILDMYSTSIEIEEI